MAAGPDGCLPELDYFPCCKVVCLWCIMCFCCWGVFPVLTLYSPRSIVWGLFFSPHLPHVMLYFSSIPCLPVLSTPLSYMYVVYVWTGWWLISLVLVTSDNKRLLLLLLLLSYFIMKVLKIIIKSTINQSLFFPDRCSGNLNILFKDLTFIDGLKKKSCKLLKNFQSS